MPASSLPNAPIAKILPSSDIDTDLPYVHHTNESHNKHETRKQHYQKIIHIFAEESAAELHPTVDVVVAKHTHATRSSASGIIARRTNGQRCAITG
jgi:hypothetical protein